MTFILFLASFAVIVLAGLGMALGVLAGRKPLCSGCTGLVRLGETRDLACLVCRTKRPDGGAS
jgi:hypothetical protein